MTADKVATGFMIAGMLAFFGLVSVRSSQEMVPLAVFLLVCVVGLVIASGKDREERDALREAEEMAAEEQARRRQERVNREMDVFRRDPTDGQRET